MVKLLIFKLLFYIFVLQHKTNNMSEETNNRELTQEEIKKRRDEVTAFYKESIKHLSVQKEYEELLRDIEIARVEKIQAQILLSQAHAASQEPEEDSEAAVEFKKAMQEEKKKSNRPLKKA